MKFKFNSREEEERAPLIAGQMSIDECIEVATTGSDGKPAERASSGHTEGMTLSGRPAPSRRTRIAELVKQRIEKGSA